MPLISFSGTTSMGSFWEQILSGKKTQTCRRPRKRLIKKDDTLFLYWKCRVPKHKKPIHFIGLAKCVQVKRIRYRKFAFDNVFAQKDGFRDSDELQEWFGDPSTYADEEYDVIHFVLRE